MIQVRRANERGHADHGWLNSKHSFSFADYYDEKHMGFGPLRVINEDRIEGGTGFGAHGHRDMEIISYVIDGALQHKDSMGNETVIKPGEVQRLTAGTGIRHSEYNQLKDRTTHFLQIWIMPEQMGLTPSYGQKSFENDLASGDLVLVASQSGKDGSITIHQDVNMYVAKTKEAAARTTTISPERLLWIQVIKGEVEANGTKLSTGDGAAMQKIDSLTLTWKDASEFILFDMPR